MSNTWQLLDHEHILNSVEKTIGEPLTSLLIQRNSYINRVFELEKKNSRERIIVKFYRPGRWTTDMIEEEHRFLFKLATEELPVIPPLRFSGKSLFALETIPYAIFPKKGGRALDEFDKERWQEIGRLLGRLHLLGETFKNSSRIIWTPEIATVEHLEFLLESGQVFPDYRESLTRAVEKFRQKFKPLFQTEKLFLIHGDCHKGNLIHRPGEGVFLVDFDDICVGPAIQDLWMLLPGTPEESEQELAWFQAGYETFRYFDTDALQLVPGLKFMRIIHFAAWCARQSADPDFARHFPEWGTQRYWNELIRDLQAII